MSLAGEQALYLKDIVKSRRARRGRARFALLAQIGELAMLHCAKELAYEHIYIYIYIYIYMKGDRLQKNAVDRKTRFYYKKYIQFKGWRMVPRKTWVSENIGRISKSRKRF